MIHARTALLTIAAFWGMASGFAAPPKGDKPFQATKTFIKAINRPAKKDLLRVRARRALIESQDRLARTGITPIEPSAASAGDRQFTMSGTDRILVVLVEFDPNHPDTFTWTPGESTWDPLGKCNTSEYNGTDYGNATASTYLANADGITAATQYTYTGPLHNGIPAPSSGDDYIWTPDFTPQWYNDLIFGNGVKFQYTRPDGSAINEDLTGYSVRDYYRELSGGQYDITGTVVGWVKVPHSVQWYGADPCPGSRSGVSAGISGGIPGAGDNYSLVRDAVDAVNAAYPGFDWKSYDQDGDGVVDRLWIIHAGVGEEDDTSLLNATPYGENGIWSHSSTLSSAYSVSSDETVGPYIIMPENCGVSVLAHEFAHNLGAEDLYAYNGGNPSAGFWTVMCNNWVGYPNGIVPPAMDPWHLDNWGWLEPKVVSDTNRVYKVRLGQAGQFPGGDGVYRGARITLPDFRQNLAVQPLTSYEWWGGDENLSNGLMLLGTPLAIPAAGATMDISMAYDIEEGWDFLWVQASSDGTTWKTLTNAHTTTAHDTNWIGGDYGFPNDLAAAGIGGFTGLSASYPDYAPETFDLSAFAGKSIYLRLWYMTDWAYTGAGPFVSSVKVTSGGNTLLEDTPDPASSRWASYAPWVVTSGYKGYSQNYYLQWRNASSTGGYDKGMADSRWFLSPVNSGLLVWLNNNTYQDNEIMNHLPDDPSYGPKGRMLVVDAHPDPYRRPSLETTYPNEASDVSSYTSMRDAPFNVTDSVPFTYGGTSFAGRPAVPTFHDTQGYYPGAEYASRGAGYSPAVYSWSTKQWDASTVVPAADSYPINGPGMADSDYLVFGLNIAAGQTTSGYTYGEIGVAGGTGNPGDTGVAHGWNVKVIDSTPTVGTVVVWNNAVGPVTAASDVYGRPAAGTLTVSAPGVLGNDSGPAGWSDVASAELLTSPMHGTVTLAADGSFTYTPSTGYAGADSFTYRIVTAYGAASAAQTVAVQPRGDLNMDGVVNVTDARLALRIVGGLAGSSVPAQTLGLADLNGDGQLDVEDAARIARLAAGKDQ